MKIYKKLLAAAVAAALLLTIAFGAVSAEVRTMPEALGSTYASLKPYFENAPIPR